MKNVFIYKLLCLVGMVGLVMSCINEDGIAPANNQMSISISIQDRNTITRASIIDSTEILNVEKIHRYDIFMYRNDTHTLSKHIGENMTIPVVEFTANFLSEAAFQYSQDVYVVVNNLAWENRTDFSTITIDSLKSLKVVGNQNYTGHKTAMSGFKGYKKGTDYEPFMMSAITNTPHNFMTNPILNLDLKRTYAKTVLVFKTNLSATDDPDWIGLKKLSIKQYANIADSAKVFASSGTGFTTALSSYVYTDVATFTHDFSGLDLSNTDGKTNVYDTFLETTNCLRVFPHAPASKSEATALEISFEVGPVGDNVVTKVFNRRILIGDKDDNYRIDPNTAYIITIETSKTDDSIMVTTKIAPWNMVYVDMPIQPEM